MPQRAAEGHEVQSSRAASAGRDASSDATAAMMSMTGFATRPGRGHGATVAQGPSPSAPSRREHADAQENRCGGDTERIVFPSERPHGARASAAAWVFGLRPRWIDRAEPVFVIGGEVDGPGMVVRVHDGPSLGGVRKPEEVAGLVREDRLQVVGTCGSGLLCDDLLLGGVDLRVGGEDSAIVLTEGDGREPEGVRPIVVRPAGVIEHDVVVHGWVARVAVVGAAALGDLRDGTIVVRLDARALSRAQDMIPGGQREVFHARRIGE